MEITELWRVLDGVQAQIRAFDTKAQIVLGIDGVVLAFFSANAWKLAELSAAVNMSCLSIAATLTGVLSICFLLASLALAVLTFYARLSVEQPRSLLFFAHISDDFGNDYPRARAVLDAISPERLKEDISNQVLANSKICSRKAHRFKYALTLMGVAFFLWISTLFLSFVLSKRVADDSRKSIPHKLTIQIQ